MPRPVLKSGLVYRAGTTAKRIKRRSNSFRPGNVRRDISDFEALGINQVAEVCLFVSSAQFPQKLDTGIIEVRLLDLPSGLCAVQRQKVMASEKVGAVR